MKATKKRLCWNCEGNVPVNLENCPYCSVYLNNQSSDDSKEEEEEDDLAPPYRLISSTEDQKVPASPFSAMEPSSSKVESHQPTADLKEAAATMSDMKTIALPLVLLLAGSICFIFSLLMLLFSEGGLFTLRMEWRQLVFLSAFCIAHALFWMARPAVC